MLPIRALITAAILSIPLLVSLFGYYDHPLFMETPLGALKTASLAPLRPLRPEELANLPSVLDSHPPDGMEVNWFSEFSAETLIDAAAKSWCPKTHNYLAGMTRIRQRSLAGYVAANINANDRMDCIDILERLSVDPDCDATTWQQSEVALRRFGKVRASQIVFESWLTSLQMTGRHITLPEWVKQRPY